MAARQMEGILFYPGWRKNWPYFKEYQFHNVCLQPNIRGAPHCYHVNQEFLYYLSTVVAREAGAVNQANVTPTGAPSGGLVTVISLLNQCATMDIYGFQLCTGADPGSVLTVETPGVGRAWQQKDVRVSGAKTSPTEHFYCQYFTDNKTSFIKSIPGHFNTAEYRVFDKLEACGLLTQHR